MCLLTFALWIGAALAKAPASAWEPPANLVEEFNRGVEAINGGNLGKAEEAAERVAAKAPECGMALLLLGNVRLRQNQPVEAIEVLSRAVELFPEQSDVQLALAQAAFGAQRFELASEVSGRALDMSPGDPMVATLAVMASLRLGDIAEARARVGRSALPAADVACLDVQVLLEAKDVPAAKVRLAACEAAPHPELVMNARAVMAGHMRDDAAVYDVAELMGLSGFALSERAGALLDAGKCAEALPVFDAALLALPKDVGLRVNHARCLVQLDRLAEAEDVLAVAMAGDTWVDTHVNGAMSGITSKSQEERLHDIQRDAAILLVEVQTRRSRTKEAATSLAAARARYGAVVQIIIAEARLVTAQGHPAEGWSLLRRAMAEFPAEPALAAALVRRAVDDPKGLDAAVVAYVRAHGTLVDRQNLGVAENNGQDWAGCAEDYAAVAAADPTRTKIAADAYACAVMAKDPDRAFALLGPLGDAAPRGFVHDHALLLQEAARHADAISLLKLYPTGDAELEAAMRRIAVRSHLALGQHAEAAALTTRPGLEPRFLAWVGQELLMAGRKDDAARIFGGTCEKLAGDDAKVCAEMREEAGRP